LEERKNQEKRKVARKKEKPTRNQRIHGSGKSIHCEKKGGEKPGQGKKKGWGGTRYTQRTSRELFERGLPIRSRRFEKKKKPLLQREGKAKKGKILKGGNRRKEGTVAVWPSRKGCREES